MLRAILDGTVLLLRHLVATRVVCIHYFFKVIFPLPKLVYHTLKGIIFFPKNNFLKNSQKFLIGGVYGTSKLSLVYS